MKLRLPETTTCTGVLAVLKYPASSRGRYCLALPLRAVCPGQASRGRPPGAGLPGQASRGRAAGQAPGVSMAPSISLAPGLSRASAIDGAIVIPGTVPPREPGPGRGKAGEPCPPRR